MNEELVLLTVFIISIILVLLLKLADDTSKIHKVDSMLNIGEDRDKLSNEEVKWLECRNKNLK